MFCTGILAACLGLISITVSYANEHWEGDQKAGACFFGGVSLLVASLPFGVVLGLYTLLQSP